MGAAVRQGEEVRPLHRVGVQHRATDQVHPSQVEPIPTRRLVQRSVDQFRRARLPRRLDHPGGGVPRDRELSLQLVHPGAAHHPRTFDPRQVGGQHVGQRLAQSSAPIGAVVGDAADGDDPIGRARCRRHHRSRLPPAAHDGGTRGYHHQCTQCREPPPVPRTAHRDRRHARHRGPATGVAEVGFRFGDLVDYQLRSGAGNRGGFRNDGEDDRRRGDRRVYNDGR